ncbi:MAG: 16S rRNA (guanine(527)-N(7))-methyltransferase RsmG [Desulfomonilaceae bacterium]
MTQPKCLPNISDILSDGCEYLGIEVSDSSVSNMLTYLELLRYWNSKFNLTSIIDANKIAVCHFLDSLTIFKVWRLNSKAHFLDIGAGAGFPGLVIKIVDESLSVALLDKNSKRIVFLKLVAKELGLQGISFINLQFQDYFQSHVSNKFDVVSFRALPKKAMKFLNIGKILNSGGSVIRMYSGQPDAEKTEFIGYHRVESWNGVLPYLNLNRCVIRYQID